MCFLDIPSVYAENNPTVHLTIEEQNYLKQLGRITMVVDPDWVPFEYVDEAGNFIGIAADLLSLVVQRLGIEIELIPTADWAETLKYSREGKALIIPFLNQTPEREKWLVFTDPLLVDANVIITREEHPFITDIRDFPGSTVVLPKGTSIEERIQNDFPDLKIITTERENAVFNMINNREADMTIRSLIIAAYTIRKEGYFNLKIAGRVPEYTNYLTMGVLKSEPMLRDILNKGIATITPQERQGIINRHVNIEIKEFINFSHLRRVIFILSILLLILLLWILRQKQINLQINKIKNTLQENENRYNELLKHSRGFVWEIDLTGKHTYISPSIKEVLGYEQEEVIGKMYFYDFLLPDEREELKNYGLRIMKSGEEMRSFDVKQVHKEGHIVYTLSNGVSVVNESGEFIGYRGTDIDITKLKKTEQEILFLSYYDQLTGLYNRRFYEEELKRLDNKRNIPISLVMIDVNGLKLVNDAFGHAAGDELLKKVGYHIKKESRANDIAARIGGDEFVLVLPNTDSKQAEKVIQRIKEKIQKEQVKEINCSVSFGWETKVDVDDNIHDTLKKAEEAMYSKKLYESVAMRHRTIKKSIDNLFEKSPYEKLHAENVSALAVMLGKALNMDNMELERLRIAAFNHDLGKTVIETSILNKEGLLLDYEWAEIKRHPEIGYQLLRSIDEYRIIANFVLSHHEKWDGSGYPNGSIERKIPLESRIIAIACSYDAMTKDKPYRKALDKNVAIEELNKHAGSQFDPELVQIFIEKVLNFKLKENKLTME